MLTHARSYLNRVGTEERTARGSVFFRFCGRRRPFGSARGCRRPFGSARGGRRPFGSAWPPSGRLAGGRRPFGSARGRSAALRVGSRRIGGPSGRPAAFGSARGGRRPFGSARGGRRGGYLLYIFSGFAIDRSKLYIKVIEINMKIDVFLKGSCYSYYYFSSIFQVLRLIGRKKYIKKYSSRIFQVLD